MLAPIGWATFAWQADYSQFYVIDSEDPDFLAPIDITPEILARSLAVPPSGLVVYTADCLQQHIRLAIYEAEPEHADIEWQSDRPWTRIDTVEARFPSRRFTLSSPSHPSPLPNGPTFTLDSELTKIRISWMEFDGGRDDSVPVMPDVIELTFWPA